MADERFAVVMPAAGAGTRLGGARKQFRLLGGAPLLVQTLRVFDRHPAIVLLALAVPADEQATVGRWIEEASLETPAIIVSGGATRQASVACALDAVPGDIGAVLVHDAVRPFLSPDRLSLVVSAVRAHGAAALAIPVSDTLRRGGDHLFGETVSRHALYRMQTPQGSRRDWLQEAHEAARRDGFEATDDVALLQRAGRPVQIVEGHPLNMKVTEAADWELARQLWPLWEQMAS